VDRSTKTFLKEIVKTTMRGTFGFAYWFVFSFMILIGWLAEGAGLGITLAVLFGLGYWFIVKMTKFFINKARKAKTEKLNDVQI
jgi:Zn-dependent protease with chaperone function